MKVKFIAGGNRIFFDSYMSLFIFIKYTQLLLSRKISLKQYSLFFKRVLLFYTRLRRNKIVKIGKVYKLHLYVPCFPKKSFFQAVDKFLVFDKDPYPISVLISMTKDCNYNCPHCYQKYDQGKDLPIEKLVEVVKQIQNLGIALINIEGGEPLLRFDRLLKLVENIDERSEVWVNTNGFGLTEEKATKMKKVGIFGVMVSLHHYNQVKYDNFVKTKGAFDTALKALRIFQKADIATVINCCLSKKLLDENGFGEIMEIAKKYGCSLVQLIHGKSAGGWLDREDPMGQEDIEKLYNYHLLYNKNNKYRNYPSVSSQVYESSKEHFGCTGGGIERFYINAYGEVQPCEFLNISFGNVQNEDFLTIYKRMRSFFKRSSCNWFCCTQAKQINQLIRREKTRATPLPKKDTLSIVRGWEREDTVPLYNKMGFYRNE